jgi:hypothetical protein
VIGHHDNLVGTGEAIDAERVQLALRAANEAVVDHDEVRIRVDDVARPDRRTARLERKHLFDCRHSHCTFAFMLSLIGR